MADTKDDARPDLGLTVLAVIGWVLPLAGILWGPGEFWAYLLWLGIGTALILLYAKAKGI